jgi:hypothetical protein
MLSAIEFNNQLQAVTREIDDVAVKMHLPTKVRPG